MITYRDFVSAFRRLGLDRGNRVLAHASLSAFGEVVGGAEAVVGAMVSTFDTVIMPAFTTRTMIVPPVGPENNALDYDAGGQNTAHAEFWDLDLPPDRDVGAVAHALRLHPEAQRSSHPILSFSGVGAQKYLEAQTVENPLAPIGALADDDGDVLLLGVDHRVNIAAHYAEQKAGRRQFVRWALTSAGILECQNYPGCSDGFYVLNDRLSGVRRRVDLGHGVVESVPLRDLIHIVTGWIREDPTAMLCDRPSCRHCQAVRQSVQVP
ncbi:MAG: AAC(3) family N-acetyltransferase [Anaerolineales bacterium]|nr:AAC(3) family N-acetyltransferase [Anaerolineales bacterium]